MTRSMAAKAPGKNAPFPESRTTETPASRATRPSAPIGNQSLLHLLAHGIQPKLIVGPPGDEFEREADRKAEAVLRETGSDGSGGLSGRPGAPSIQREAAEKDEEEEEDGRVRRMPLEETAPRREEEEEEEEKEEVRASGLPARIPIVTRSLESRLDVARGGGRALPAPLRARLENSLGSDLGGVRVHADPSAASAARDLGAKAFTRGRDIFFGAGQYRPQTRSGFRLLAHEVAHTIQQGNPGAAVGGVSRGTGGSSPPLAGSAPDRVRRQPDDPTAAGPSPTAPTPTASPAAGTPPPAAEARPSLPLGTLHVPEFKFAAHGDKFTAPPKPLFRAAAYRRGSPGQAAKWDRAVSTAGMKSRLERPPFSMDPDGGYIIRAEGHERFTRIGNAERIAPGLARPFWTTGGNFEEHQVDHIVELQVSGWPVERWANEIDNMELLSQRANASSGAKIANWIEGAVENLLKAPPPSLPVADRELGKVKGKYDLVFESVEGDRALDPDVPVSRWSKTDVEEGRPLDVLTPSSEGIKLYDLGNPNPVAGSIYSPHDFVSEAVIGSQTSFLIYRHGFGGSSFALPWRSRSPTPTRNRGDDDVRIYGLDYYEIGFDWENSGVHGPGLVGYLKGRLFKKQKDKDILRTPEAERWGIKRVPGTKYAGYLDARELRGKIEGAFSLPGMSPIEIDEFDIDERKGLVMVGRVLPSIPLFRALDLMLVVEGDDLRVEREFAKGDFDVPRPFEISESTLALSIGTETGLRVRGRVDFGIENIGSGYLGAVVGTSEGFALEGGFSFDSRLFNPAEIRLRYEHEALSGEGRLGIPPNRVRGIGSADVRVAYAAGRFEASGTAELAIPGIRRGAMSLSYSEAEGLAIGGLFELSDDIPGIQGGSVQARVRTKPGGEGYLLAVEGRAVPKVPGVSAELLVSYEDGAFAIEGTAAYARGPLSGSIQIGVTNRPLDAAGQPAGEPTDRLRAYGGGTVTVRVTPWLQGTVGVRLLQNGQLEVSGSIGLPSAVEIFPAKTYERNIFTIGIDIPIVGVAFAGQRIGIFATIRGGLDLSAGVGPGELRELRLGVTYNPDREEETRVRGDARLVIPAQAGLRLFVRGGLGAGIPIVSATAGLEIGGRLGLEGAVEAGVTVDWTPARGLVLDAVGQIYVEPKLRFDVTGFVLVEANLLLKTITLFERRWELAAFEFGSNLRFGVRLPIHYEEGKPFDISWDRVEFQVPDIDPEEVLKGLIRRIA